MSSDTAPLLAQDHGHQHHHDHGHQNGHAAVNCGEAGHDADEHQHYTHRSPWLRAFILGANDGLVSVACVILGVAGGSDELHTLWVGAGAVTQWRLAGLAAWIAGALSMAVGEYISVAGQRDCEEADVQKERDAQAKGPEMRQHELDELTEIYVKRGLSPALARQVAEELTATDVIRAHARDELGIDLDDMADPLQAAVVSGLAFTAGAIGPLLAGSIVPDHWMRVIAVVVASSLGLALFGYIGAALGGARVLVGTVRVLVGGWLAMAITYAVGVGFAKSILG